MARFIRLVSILAFAAACGKDSTSGTPNTGPYGCLGQALPTTAPTTITVTGTITHGVISPAPDSGATVTAYRTGNVTPLATTTTAANGTFTLNIGTGGTPVDGYLKIEKTGYITTYAYPPAPLAANESESAIIVTTSEFATLSNVASVSQDPAKGFIAVVVEDCTGAAIAGATISTTPAAGTIRYNSGGIPSSSATSTAADGIGYAFNVTAGDVVVAAQTTGHVLRAHTVAARTDGITLTAVTPGP
jgi:hypothetical protein